MENSTRRAFVGAAAAGVVGGATLSSVAGEPRAKRSGRRVVAGSPYPTFSRAVALNRFVFVAGVVGQKPGSRAVVSPEFAPQCRQAMENLNASVEASGSSMDQVLKCGVFLTDAADFAAFNKIYVEYFPQEPPARSTVIVKELVVPGAKLEIDCVTSIS